MQLAYEGMYGAEGELQVLLTTGCQLRCSVKAKVDPLHESAGTGADYFSCLISAIDRGGLSASRLCCFTPMKEPQYPLWRRLSVHCTDLLFITCRRPRCTVRTSNIWNSVGLDALYACELYTGLAKSRYTVINYILYTYFWPTLLINQSHYRPEVPRGFQEVKSPRLRDSSPG